jgi:two-component system phosphate regulon response regulator OmpR
MKQRILIIDDDHRHRNLVANYLATHNFDTLMAADAVEMKKQRERFRCDLLVLDINLPKEDGISICQRLRAEGDMIPIIFLTGRGHVFDRILGLEYGADDYLAKPFEPLELVARVRAILRRVSEIKVQDTIPLKVHFGAFMLDIVSRSLLCDGGIVSLSFDEFELLKILASTPGQPKSRNQLANQLKGDDQHIDQRYIDMLVSRLRKRLKDDSSQPQYIQTVRGVGYVFKNAIPNQLAS